MHTQKQLANGALTERQKSKLEQFQFELDRAKRHYKGEFYKYVAKMKAEGSYDDAVRLGINFDINDTSALPKPIKWEKLAIPLIVALIVIGLFLA